jgi:SMC interacting uncharacterized protein involved in chromosome segregation
MEDPELIRILTRIESKLDNLEKIYEDHLQEHSDHETRIRSLEKKIWSLPSLATIIAIASVLIPFLVHN